MRPDVYALSAPDAIARRPLLEGTPSTLLGVLALAASSAWGLCAAGVLSAPLARAIAAGAAQGALMATAVGWTIESQERARPIWAAGAAIVALVGAIGAALSPLGAIAYLLAPLWFWRRRARLPALGFRPPYPARLTAIGAALGAVLGAHLTITASLTLGYRVGWPSLLTLLPWLAYDVGANVLAAECFFRGALFDRAQRRWSFAAAAAVTTGTCLARYLADPLLPRTLEVAAGAAFYIGLLSVGNCWLYWRSGSVVPGLAAGVVFFIVYRLLHVVR